MLMMGRRFRGLGKKDAYRLLRWAPMSAADFVSEWFESEPLRAVDRGRRHLRHRVRAAIGRQRGGAVDADGRGRRPRNGSCEAAWDRSRRRSRRRPARPAPRSAPDAEVRRIHVKDGRATGVTLSLRRGTPGEGGRVECRSAADTPRVDRSGGARAGISRAHSQLSSGGNSGEDQPRVERASEFHRAAGRRARAWRLHSHRPRARLSRARVRCVEVWRVVAAAVPRRDDSIGDRSHARAGRRACDVDYGAVSHPIAFASRSGRMRLRRFADAAIDTLDAVRARTWRR